MSPLLDAVSDVMLRLALHPLGLSVDADGARLGALMEERALRTRSRGPYTPDDPPPEALQMAKLVMMRLFQQPQPDFTIEGGGPWPSLLARFRAERVVVRYVVPEFVPPELYVPPPNDITLSSNIRMALEQLSRSLRLAGRLLGEEPPVSLSLSYPEDPQYEARAASRHEGFPDTAPPVIAALDVGRSACSRKQRAAHDEALRAVVYEEQPVEKLGGTGFSTRTGWALLRDPAT